MSNPSISLDPDVRHNSTEPSHVPVHLHRRHELFIKIQPKEWTTALVLKNLLVSWDLWTYRIGFKLGININIIFASMRNNIRCGGTVLDIFTSMRQDDTMCWYRHERWLSQVRTYDSSSNNNNNKTTIIYYS